MGDASTEASTCDRADTTTSVPRATTPPLRPPDAELIAAWATSSIQAAGWAPSSVESAQKGLRAFARRLSSGLLQATKTDVADFFQDRQLALHRREARKDGPGLAPARLSLLRRPSWALFVPSGKRFYVWLERRGLVSPNRNPFRGIRE